jgi:4-hydroxybenzoate polyprenyltransferase
VLAGLLTLCGFQLAVGSVRDAWLPALAIVVIASSTMVWNDYCDREHDRKKGKDFAHLNRWRFLAFGIILWLASIGLCLLIGIRQSWPMAYLALGITASGLIYSETRRIPFVPNAMVALTAASPLLFPLAAGHLDFRLLFLFVAVVLAIHAREIAKDVEDLPFDPGYKWSLPQYLGADKSLNVLRILLLIAGFICGNWVVGTSLIFLGLYCLNPITQRYTNIEQTKIAKMTIDIATVVLVLGIFAPTLPLWR